MVARLERIVRPFIPPNIRPKAKPAAVVEDDEDRGVATISGAGGQLISLNHSRTEGFSRGFRNTYFQIYDLVRVYVEGSSTRYTDIKWVTFVRMRSETGAPISYSYPKPQPSDFTSPFEILQEDIREDIAESQLGPTK